MQLANLSKANNDKFKKSFILSSNDPLNDFLLTSNKKEVKIDKKLLKADSLNPVFEEQSEVGSKISMTGKVIDHYKSIDEVNKNAKPVEKLMRKAELENAIKPFVKKDQEMERFVPVLANGTGNASFKRVVHPKDNKIKKEVYKEAPTSFDIALSKTREGRKKSIMSSINQELRKIATTERVVTVDRNEKAAINFTHNLKKIINQTGNNNSLIDASIQTDYQDISLYNIDLKSSFSFKDNDVVSKGEISENVSIKSSGKEKMK